jgi:RNA binding exosome subunit
VTRPVRKLSFRVFQHATEDLDKVVSALKFVSGTDKVRESRAEGYYGNPIRILEADIGSRKEMDDFWSRVKTAGLYPALAENLVERINNEGELYIRFDKQEAVKGRLRLSSGDDVITARGRIMRNESGRELRADGIAAAEEMERFLSTPPAQPETPEASNLQPVLEDSEE